MKKKKKPWVRGRTLDLKNARKILLLRRKGLSFREIGKALGRDVSSVYVTYKKVLMIYPQGKI